jgi:hypothetical protein
MLLGKKSKPKNVVVQFKGLAQNRTRQLSKILFAFYRKSLGYQLYLSQ